MAVMLCGDIKNGYSVHKCEDCGFEHKVGCSCGQRFCNRCGYPRTENLIRRTKSKVLNVGHHHIIVTMLEVVWKILAYERDLLQLISQTGHKVIQ